MTISEADRSSRPVAHRNLAGFTLRETRKIKIATAQRMKTDSGRFEIYEHLSTVYGIYRSWKRRGIARKTARLIAHQLGIPWRKAVSPIRILIEATLPHADSKQKSRWVRALQYASSKSTSGKDLRRFFQARQGIAGCARLAAKQQPKQDRRRNDWTD
jgi:hypothetical protein